MAHYTVNYMVQSCPKCGKKLLKVQSGTTKIGSPLIDCKKCGITYSTPLRVEWYKYPQKWVVFVLPFIIAAVMMIVGTVAEGLAMGIVCGVFGLLFGLCFMIPNVVRIIQSVKRMRDAAYLQRLLQFQLISLAEYNQLRSKI